MSNEYFDNTQNRIANGTTARAPDVNNVIDATAAAFDLLPDPQSIWGDRETVGLCGGTANAILLTIGGQTPIPYQDGQGAIFQKLNGNNTGACTLAIDAGSPKPLVNFNEEELVAGDLVNRRWYHVRYDAADDRWMIVNQITVGALDAAVASAASSATDALNYASSASAASIAAWNQKGYAEEWAQAAEDTPVSVAAGGDGATDFSARHWAAKSAASAATALQDVVDDTSPELGGALDILAFDIVGDFSAGATSRPSFKTNLTDGTTVIQAKPDGAGNSSTFVLYSASDEANAGRFYFSMAEYAAMSIIESTSSGTGTTRPISIRIDSTEIMGLASDGVDISQEISLAAGAHIRGDFTAADRNDRPSWQSSTAAAASVLHIKPNETGSGAYLVLNSEPNANNSDMLSIGNDGTACYISSTFAGTGAENPLQLRMGPTSLLTINTDDRILLGDSTTDALGAEAGSVTISTGDSGVTTVSGDYDDLVIEGSAVVGMTLCAKNNSFAGIHFADPDNPNAGAINYSYVADAMTFKAADTTIARCDGTNQCFIVSAGTDLYPAAGGLVVSTGDSGETSPNANGDDLIIEGSGNTGMTVYVPDSVTAQARIALGSPTKQQGGGIRYYPDDDIVRIGGIGVTGTVVTIDVENGGQAILVDTDKIAHFTGVAKVNMIHMHKTSDVALTGSFADVTWETEIYKNDDVYSHTASSAEIAVDADGWYKVTAVISSYHDTGTDRCGSQYKLQADTTGSYVDVPGTLVSNYNRDVDTGYGSATIVSILQLSATDTVKVVAQQYDGTDTVYLDADGCTFTMERVA